MSKKPEKSVPDLRFKGFTNDWEQRKLGDLSEIVRGASPRPISDSKWFDKNSDIGWLRISDVTNQNGRIYYLEQHISKLGQEKTRVITEPHLLLSIAATVGKPLINFVKTGVHDGFLIFLNPFFDIEYMFQWLEMFRPQWSKYGQPGSQVNLNSDIVKNQKIMIPCEKEQERIANILKTTDSLITLHQRKLELLKQNKKFFLQNMFPKNGEKIPEIRFSEFNNDWEQRKLGELGRVLTGNTPKTSENKNWSSNNDGYSWITPSDITSLSTANTERKLTDDGWKKARVVPENSVLITSIASIGKNTINTVPAAFNQQINAIIPTKNDSYFILSSMERNKLKFESLAGTTATAIINKKTFSNFQIYVPNLEEQVEVGKFMKNIDTLITIHQNKLEKLQNLKKFLLNKLFI